MPPLASVGSLCSLDISSLKLLAPIAPLNRRAKKQKPRLKRGLEPELENYAVVGVFRAAW